MRNVPCMFAMVAALAMMSQVSFAADTSAPQAVTGVLIDQACAGKMMKTAHPEKAAKKHPRSCAMAPACEASGYAVIKGDKEYKLDANGNKLAKEFLANSTKKNDLMVDVEGTVNGDQIDVTSVKAASDESEK